MQTLSISISTQSDIELFGSLDLPADGKVHTYALFAHCFTCSSELGIVRHISRALTLKGIGVMRFDFTGLGQSSGAFADTNFSNNVADLLDVFSFMKTHYSAPEILIGHSLGGAAILMAAASLKNIKAMVTIGAPAEPQHVTHLFEEELETIERQGTARVNIGGRPFEIKKQFIDDLEQQKLPEIVRSIKKPYLIMHAPLDNIVGINNAAKLYDAAFHPKSFISLDGADHLLSKKRDALYAAEIIASWLKRYVPEKSKKAISTEGQQVVAHHCAEDAFTTDIFTPKHKLIADEPTSFGGLDLGPSPYELLNAAVGACTAMTVKLYAKRKKWPLESVSVFLNYEKRHMDAFDEKGEKMTSMEYITKKIRFTGKLDEKQRHKLLEIAAKCPVHRTLSQGVHFDTVEIE